ncbi:type 1 glutamine amidotransferase [Aeromicrobium wangtongii]|uniref:type 1 glutamine amidotransferase n=1 Tax=Aeromicrobium wangtongii TaxID=2969247 RepID=UPI002017CFD7|nr:gamma-glutamyl-gamma-aminobutyrate hydrolase family protein [Aeromicrobium wangtongii]MCL3818954.1 gamma-glutamyl-gamma-aminobutyrate hydrolase family protein [Aeromicrobium wangtongii]
MRIHVVADTADKDGGYVVERLVQRGGEIVELDRDALPAHETIGDSDLVLLLGSDKSAHEDKWIDSVTAEIRFVRASLKAGTPVMGICYGAQIMARALGGTSWRSDQAELGWARVDTTDQALCPEGPWGQMHRDVFAPGPTTKVIGTSWRGPQCIIDDSFGARAIGWQFHPEVTPATYERWVKEGYWGDTGADPKDLIRQAYDHAPGSRNLAHRLTDAALSYLGVA